MPSAFDASQLEIVVILVRADPESVVMISSRPGESAITAADLDGVDAAFLAEA